METALKDFWPRNLKSEDTFTSVHRLIATIAMETIAFDVRVAMVDKSLGNGAGASNLPADCHYSRMVCGMNHERPRRHPRYTNVYHGATHHRKKIWSFIRAEGLSRSAEQQFVVMWAAGILHIPRMLAIRACWWDTCGCARVHAHTSMNRRHRLPHRSTMKYIYRVLKRMKYKE